MLSELKKEFGKLIEDYVKKNYGLDVKLGEFIEIPPAEINADLALPLFKLAGLLKKSPVEIAKQIVNGLKENYLGKLEAVGPYVNLILEVNFLYKKLIGTWKNLLYFKSKNQKNILIEFPSPNTNKPLHLGHVRNMLLGTSVSNVLDFLGYDVLRVDLLNDRGIHICQSMLVYKLWGENKEPDKKGDHFVGDWYVKFNSEKEDNPQLVLQAQEMLKERENGNKAVVELWKKMNSRVIQGFQETYKRYGVFHHKIYRESEVYTLGKEIVLDAYKKGICQKDEKGNIICDLTQDGLDQKVVLRADGTSVYMTQDIGLAVTRLKEYDLYKMIYITASEQLYHFKVLFLILEKLGYDVKDKLFHLNYGMIFLPEGKMKSREGKVVDADDLAEKMKNLALEKLKEKYGENLELDDLAEKIGMASIKFFILKYEVEKNFVFNLNEALSFSGETGPYLLYTFVRAKNILEKSGADISFLKKMLNNSAYKNIFEIKNFLENINLENIVIQENWFESEENIDLVKKILLKIMEFEDLIYEIGKTYKIDKLSKYVYLLSTYFNSLYSNEKFLFGDLSRQKFFSDLTSLVFWFLFMSLSLLNIDLVEKM